ncbi:hypothetical protein BCV44_04620 [Vibrio cyclitrophicus]|uniref:hypothetical protein n=1 Tax=Vibrio cyclitrophicus TaxID=47951 RepID=UPI000C832F23|nr:hypothetical protein [Vibrio cyclitrophicus]PME09152.1 hypothetical protein BCV44_04620 [Vibrio cyclitrophicus]
MTHLLAYTGPRLGGLHKILSTDSTVFEVPNLESTFEYSPSTTLDVGEWFVIENFTDCDYKNDFVSKSIPINTTSLNQLPVDKYAKITYLCSEQGQYKLFQKFVSSQFINKRWFEIDEPSLKTDSKIISFSDSPDAVFCSIENKLYFRDIAKAKAIFKGIEALYREATTEEVESFLQKDFIDVAPEYNADSVKVPNRKRIALIMDQISEYTTEDKTALFSYINTYIPTMEAVDGKLRISSEEDLKHVLFGIDERYYTTDRSRTQRIANSIVELSTTQN